eukprot:2569868-Alexandrium_andersonii.AAC.1
MSSGPNAGGAALHAAPLVPDSPTLSLSELCRSPADAMAAWPSGASWTAASCNRASIIRTPC